MGGLDAEKIVEVPYTELGSETLRALVEEFATRDGTDYGAEEKSVAEKSADVMRQLERGEAIIVFDRVSETINIVPAPGTGRPGRRPGSAGDADG